MVMDMRKSGLTSTADSGSYSDLNRLNQLKVGDDKNSEGNMRKVAQEFESLFLSEMLKSMRSATEALGKDNPMNTPAAKQYQEMYDQQLAVSMSREGGGIGLADVLMRQMQKNKPVDAQAATLQGPATAETVKKVDVPTEIAAGTQAEGPLGRSNGQRPLWAYRVAEPQAGAAASHSNDMELMNQRRIALPSKLTDRLLAGIVPSTQVEAKVAPLRNSAADDNVINSGARSVAVPSAKMQVYGRAIAQPPLAPAKKAFSSQDEFVATMLPMAKAAAARIGIDPKYLVAQAALETGWGKSVMRAEDGSSSHNLFGIKAGQSWQGGQARAITSEFRDGAMVKETAQFRSYSSYQDSFHDLVTLLQSNDRYKEVVKSADNPEQFVRELQKAGYATDPAYASKISQIAKNMNSYQNYAAAGATTHL
ncbi:flagellar assembly peptidoglycan hydrolase FlgJ [Pseudomonas fluorescens]|jgi:flagellar protein FlgJ|uniref:Peptidoglycan hydrolase FlgJ n=1 Tax=Pseudomonas fluorescens TaxID=294 RepID=A0A2N1EEH3_PSEFL|nr:MULTISPECIES: flagellar assembly peptidoglycan hydrolase FlgJ [Pseudomonas]MBD8097813.1 flagellar assembly peptidoglycan hydrolase FlgJ [Pseudomonas fluorescens]MBD8773776.1 flagellar assembly peptidoglycan hydrolase FlgJ [Pseudomonas fluorescens]MBD8778023.1 flagellar assembly peptidoglycan hydrolase FlgJ [Pseudomonas fluorescens]MBD8793709.1 flagellar assembly peptidoglycan hydrolase FlgJ [Pseudomonas fluorescens]PKH26104.1 peptidoglycan hydrolase FlgJ [Pseudomonas fluorescens]